MVFVNDKKFACEACIKGHRSSSCTHADRPLYEIKKKGRPVSQCPKCRELRSTKRVHSKCTCGDAAKPRAHDGEKSFGTKQKRYIPAVPTLPNGLQDMFTDRSDAENASTANPRQRVDALLNPCKCADVWSCTCSSAPTAAAEAGSSSLGLAALARAAELFENSASHAATTASATSAPIKQRKRRPSPTPFPPREPPKQAPGPELPPLSFPPAPPTMPSFARPPLPPPPAMPSFNTFRSLAGSGCTCGLHCSCPGCADHDGGENDNTGKDVGEGEGKDAGAKCGDSCAHCVDQSVREVDLSAAGFGFSTSMHAGASSQESSVARSAVLDHFFAHAARVPPLVPGGKPVALPKLCCGGDCGCGVRCGCGAACGGCCSDEREREREQLREAQEVQQPPPPLVKKSCCAK